MNTYPAVVERDADTGLYVGWVPGFPGAHSQGETLDELYRNLQEVIELLLQDGEMPTESEFVGVQHVRVGSSSNQRRARDLAILERGRFTGQPASAGR